MAGALPPRPPLPPDSRTRISISPGTPAQRVEDAFQLAADSPVVNAWPFVNWVFSSAVGNANQRFAEAPRSHLVWPILMGTRRPMDSDMGPLGTFDLLTSELDHDQSSLILRQLDSAKAFDVIYPNEKEWKVASTLLKSKVNDPSSLHISPAFFAAGADYDSRHESHLNILKQTPLADLIRADDAETDNNFQPHALARALTIFGSKDNDVERTDRGSVVSLATERVSAIVKKLLRADPSNPPSAPNLASKMVTALAEMQLPSPFRPHAFVPAKALREFEWSYEYSHGTPAEARAVEKACLLNTGQDYGSLKTILGRFTNGFDADTEIARLAAGVLPATALGQGLLLKLSALDNIFAQAAWHAAVTHHLNVSPHISGADLITALITTQAELAGASSGARSSNPGGGSDPSGSTDGTVSYGGVRDAALGDALRDETALSALATAKTQQGADRVATFMYSGSTLLIRAMFLQEAWLLNKSPDLGFCSLDEPYLCQHFANCIVEDRSTGEIPERLRSFIFTPADLSTLRARAWSKVRFLEMGCEKLRLERGSAVVPVGDQERYTVESCLRIISDIGSRLTFALGLALDPQDGLSFTEGCDKMIEAVAFAKSLPAAECQQWLSDLTRSFKTDWLDAGGERLHSKVRSARPDHPDAHLDSYLRDDCTFVTRTDLRMKHAAPIADMRLAFPSLLASTPVSLPGTSSSFKGSPRPPQDKGKGDGKVDKKRKPGGKSPASGGRADANGSEPGSKSSWSYVISDKELWHCGTVFKNKEVMAYYKVTDPSKLCLPVIFSKKKGDAALQLCPNPAAHGGITSKAHTRPSNFDLNLIYSKYTRKPTKAENEAAGWVPAKRKKA